MVFQNQGVRHSFLEVRIDPYSNQVTEQPSKYLMDMLHPYRIILIPFLCRHIDGQRYHLSNAQFPNQGITLSFQDFSSQILYLGNQLPFKALLVFQ